MPLLSLYHSYMQNQISSRKPLYPLRPTSLFRLPIPLHPILGFYSNPRKYRIKSSASEREIQRQTASTCPGTPSAAFLVFHVLLHSLCCNIFLDCYKWTRNDAEIVSYVINTEPREFPDNFPWRSEAPARSVWHLRRLPLRRWRCRKVPG